MTNVAFASRPQGMWGVKDLNATTMGPDGQFVPRTHQILTARGVIKRVPLVADKEAFLPEAEARQFLKDNSFEVTNALGNVVPALSTEVQERVAPSRLGKAFVIAKWSELTDDALLTRAGVRAGFEQLPPTPGRELLIDFLEGSFAALEPEDPKKDEDAVEGEEAGGAALAAKMLGGE